VHLFEIAFRILQELPCGTEDERIRREATLLEAAGCVEARDQDCIRFGELPSLAEEECELDLNACAFARVVDPELEGNREARGRLLECRRRDCSCASTQVVVDRALCSS